MEKLEKEILELKAKVFDINCEMEQLNMLRQQLLSKLQADLQELAKSKESKDQEK